MFHFSKSKIRKVGAITVSSIFFVSAAFFSPLGNGANHVAAASQNIIAFPGAEGGGKFATGGRGGEVVYVTNLNDSGTGSFRDAVGTSNRIVVFKVGGTIELKSDVVAKSNITVAGQTAPGGAGITLKNYKIGLGGDNIILRFISSRPGERGTNADYDAFGGANGSNSIVDHCSLGWANDEQWGLYSQNDNYTVQYSIIGPSNSFSYHSKGIHGFGIMLGRANASWHHNLIVHNVSRNFRGKVVGTNTIDFTNNVIYNWGSQTAYGTLGHVNYVNNTLKMGVSTISGKNYISVGDSGTSPENYSIYLTGNRFLSKDNTNYGTFTSNNWTGITYGADSGKTEANTRSDVPFTMFVNGENVSTVANVESSEDSYNHVLDYAGAGISTSQRPAIDKQVANETRTGTGTLTGGRPYSGASAEQKATIDKYKMECGVQYKYPDAVLTGVAADTDGDGMPDEWETARGLNPNSAIAADGTLESKGDYCGQGYTNIEYYINDLTVNAFPSNIVKLSPVITPTPIPEGQYIKSLVVNDATNAANWSIQSNLQVGDPIYGDRIFKFDQIPANLLGAEWIRTACDSKSYTSELASFTAKSNVSVYVGLDSRVATIPTWLSSWTNTGESLSGDNDVTFSLYKKDFSSGSSVGLGLNGQSSGAVNYTVIVKPNTP